MIWLRPPSPALSRVIALLLLSFQLMRIGRLDVKRELGVGDIDHDHTAEAEMSREHDLNSLFAALSARGITVRSMRNKANRLEELFVRLVESGKEAA